MAAAQKLENKVGAIIPNWQRECPFCGMPVPTSCGIDVGWTDPNKRGIGSSVTIVAICTRPKVASPQQTKQENKVGAVVEWDGKTCPFCRGLHGSAGCGWGGYVKSWEARPLRVVMNRICKLTPMSTEISVQGMSHPLPSVNCPHCGAYGADRHRRGCEQAKLRLVGDTKKI